MTASRRKLFIWTAIALTAVVAVSSLFDVAVAAVLNRSIERLTGTRVEADRVHFDPFGGHLSVRHLKLLQPPGFPKGKLADIPIVRVDFDTLSFFGKTPHVRQVFVHCSEVVVVRNKEGQLNVDALRLVREGDKAGGRKMDVDKLVLTLDRVIQKDFTGEKPTVERIDLNIQEAAYENLPGTAQLIGVVLGQALQAAAIKGAMIYGTAAVAGVAFLPVGAAFLLTSNDSAESDVRSNFRDSYRAAIRVARALGEVTGEDARKGVVNAKIDGSDVTVQIFKRTLRKCHVKISARKMLLPQPKTAGGFLYELMQITG